MRVFLYEYITGGGLLGGEDESLQSLKAEGRSMLTAVAQDFVAVDGTQVTSTRDARLADFNLPSCLTIEVAFVEEERETFDRLATEADATLLIAPELDGALRQRAEWVEAAGGRLISPGSDFVAVASDKTATNRRLSAAGVPVPESRQLEVNTDGTADLPRNFYYPAVVKRIDGAGSLAMLLCTEPMRVPLDPRKPWMIEHYCAGIPASAAVLCGSNGLVPLPPFRQRFKEGSFSYVGGIRLAERQFVDRAQGLAVRAVRSLGMTTGYVGVDLVLGEARNGSEDFVIEINPRLTTSYIGLRAIACGNLAAAMLDASAGRPVSLSFDDETVEFAVGDRS